MSELIVAKECYQIVGACFEVYNEKGCGFLEQVYQVNFGRYPGLEWKRIVRTKK